MKDAYEQCTESLHSLRLREMNKTENKLKELEKKIRELQKELEFYKGLEIDDEQDY